MQGLLIPARFFQLLGVAVLCGSALFFLYGYPPRGERWPRILVLAAALVAATATAVWLLAQAANLGDGGFDPEVLGGVALETQFGQAALLRLAVLTIAAALALWRPAWRELAVCGAIAAASFAWTGHGASNDGLEGLAHQGADVVHMLAASIWIGALPPLAILAFRTDEAARVGLRRFSGIGPAVVAVLLASGLVNAGFVVGPSQIPTLTSTAYGRVLALKLLLFVAMLGLAALNRWRLGPRLGGLGAPRGAVRASLLAETALAAAVLAAVAVLGLLNPPMGG